MSIEETKEVAAFARLATGFVFEHGTKEMREKIKQIVYEEQDIHELLTTLKRYINEITKED